MVTSDVAAALATLMAVAVALSVAVALWSWWQSRRVWRALAHLEQRLRADLEPRELAPAVRLVFEFDRQQQAARLHITNTGAAGNFRAPLTVHGPLATPVDRPLFARWVHTNRPATRIDSGQTATLALARLELSFPFACWYVQTTDVSAAPSDLPAAHSSMLGGTSSRDVRPLLLEFRIVSDDPTRAAKPGVVALGPFSAEWVIGKPTTPVRP